MDLKQILENKVLMASIIGGVVLVLIVFIICGSLAASNKSNNEQIDVSKEPLKEDVDLLTTDNMGKALEIQALLARNNIVAARAVDGTKSVLKLKKGDCTPGMKKCTTEQRDRAIMVIVESGLYDHNVGLEIFDKGDFTSTKEDKRIRLVRAMDGELARLIRRIVRDNNFRGYSALHTLRTWASVNRGENKNIFPYQENCDVMFNSSLIYELSVLKKQALPFLQEITNAEPEYAEAKRLVEFLKYFEEVDEGLIPQNSLLREFVGGSIFGD